MITLAARELENGNLTFNLSSTNPSHLASHLLLKPPPFFFLFFFKKKKKEKKKK
jgi:hypothetical protein